MSVATRLEPAFVSVEPAATAESVLHVRNTGEIVEAYRFELVGVPAEWGVVEPAELSLYPGTSGTVAVRISPPRGTEPVAGRYPFAVRAVPVERPDEVQVPEGVVEVLPAADLDAALLARTRRGRLGARFQIAVRNAGNFTAAIAAEAAEPDGKLRLRARPEAEDFAPGEEGHFRIRARPRRPMLKGSPRTQGFRVTVTLREARRLGADEVEGGGVGGDEVEGGGAEADAAATEGGQEPDRGSTTSPAPHQAAVQQSASTAAASAVAQPPDPARASAPAPQAVSKSFDAVFEQRPIIPAGAGKLVAALAALAALCTAAWFLLVKPAVTSAAHTTASQVAAAVMQHQASSSPAAGAGGSPTSSASTKAPGPKPAPSGTTPATTPKPTTPSPTKSGTSATSTATTPSPPPSTPSPTTPPPPSTTPPKPSPTPAPTSTTANFDTALAVQPKPGQSATATFTTPARSTFLITDYVLENPQGDNGTIAVTVNGTQVSVLALEDFRDDDYPWVTPLAVPAGAHVTITVNCAAPGTPPDVPPPATCSEFALFNGTMTTAK